MVEPNELAVECEAPNGGKAFRLKLDARKLAKALAKGIVFRGFGAYDKAIAEGIEALDAIGVRAGKPPTVEQQAWLWVHRAAFSALAWTIRSSPTLADRLGNDEKGLEAFVTGAQSEKPVPITLDFLDRPANSPFFERLQAGMAGGLKVIEATTEDQAAVGRRLAQEFTIQLDLEMRNRRQAYQGLEDFFKPTLVDAAAERARKWRRYAASLQEAVRKPLLNLASGDRGAVCLEEFFVPFRAWYPASRDEASEWKRVAAKGDVWEQSSGRERPVFVGLQQHIDRWLNTADAKDAIRVISGEPGCGKSAFAEMWAAAQARTGRRVLYVPLHMLSFDRDASAPVQAFAQADTQLGCDPFDGLASGDPVILILDGLDELSRVNETGGEVARTFFESLNQKLFQENYRAEKPRVLALLIGRPLAVHEGAATLNNPGQRVEILRLRVQENEFPKTKNEDLPPDLRDEWWQKYFRATGQPGTGMPQEYKSKDKNKKRRMDDITAQPLLNYLLALVRDEKLLKRQSTAIDSVHALYGEVFELLYKRKKGELANRRGVADRFTFPDYKRFMEEVAIAAWHSGGDRAVSSKAIEERFAGCDERLREPLKQFYGSLKTGLFAVLSTFFVAPDASGPGHYTFTHKSFREYLTAGRIVREVERLHKLLADPDVGETQRGALVSWYALTAHAPIDEDLRTFLKEEIAARVAAGSPVANWRDMLKGLFEANLKDGIPGYREAPTFREAARRAANAEATLFVTMMTCAHASLAEGETLKLDWQGDGGARALLQRGEGMPAARVLRLNLNHLSLAKQVLVGTILFNADLSGADLRGAQVSFAHLLDASLLAVNLIGADLSYVNLVGARFIAAKLIGAKLIGANLIGANLRDVDLSDADLSDADLRGADLGGARVDGARLSEGTNLRGAKNLPEEWRNHPSLHEDEN